MAVPQILQQLGRNQSPQMNQIKQLMNMAKSMQNPMEIPQIKQVMDFVNNTGGDPQKVFYALAKQRGVNPEDILRQLR